MNIIANVYELLNTKAIQSVPKKYQRRFKFGFECLSYQPITSLNANARKLLNNRKTAERKIQRVVHTELFPNVFLKIFQTLKLVNKEDKIIIDFSDFNERQVLMFSKQTMKGRSIPLYFEFLKYPINEGSQNLFIIHAIDNFLAKTNYEKVIFVFDRGFAYPAIIEYLCDNKQLFIIRIKKIKYVKLKNGRKRKVEDLHFRDAEVYAYENNLRIVRSNKVNEYSESWYLVTNCFKLADKKILKVYYYRFEIEEFFRDAKRLSDLEYLWKVCDQTFITVLWFVILGFWLFWISEDLMKEWSDLEISSKQKLSYLRYCFEKIQNEIYLIFRKHLEKCA